MTVQRVHFLVGLIGLKAEIEALTGLQQGSRLAYATDTDELGTYDGAAWHWGELDAIGSGWDGNIVDIDETSSADIGEALADDDQWIVYNTSGAAWVRSAVSRIYTYIKSLIGLQAPTRVSDTLSTGTYDDYSPTGYDADTHEISVTPTGTVNISGLQGGAAGRIVIIHNHDSTNLIYLIDQGSSASIEANQFLLPNASDYIIEPFAHVVLIYDPDDARWQILSTALVPELVTTPLGDTSGAGVVGDAPTVSLSNHRHPLSAAYLPATWDGWQAVDDTWTRTGNHTFTVSGDVTATYRKGAKVRYKDGGAYEHGTIYSSSYSSPNTTVTLITNTNYAMAAATITDTYISYVENPEGWPEYFDYAPSYAGSGSMTYTSVTTNQAKWKTQGVQINVWIDADGTTGGSASTALLVDAPVAIPAVFAGMACAAATRDATAGGRELAKGSFSSTTQFAVQKHPVAAYGLGTGRALSLNATYPF